MNRPAPQHAPARKLDCLLLIVLTALMYARTLGHEFQMSWDDNWYIVYNESIQGFSWQNIKTIFSSIYQANYAPLQMLSYMIDYSIWGLEPGAFALTNIIFHALNGLLLYRLVCALHGERALALVAAAIFLAHPLQVESVAWISCRKNVLSLLFFLLSWEGYRRYRLAEHGRGLWHYGASVFLFLLSLMAKSTTLVLPAILVLHDLCFAPGERRLRLRDKIPYAAAALVFALVSIHFQHTEFQGGIRMPYHGGSPLASLYTMLPVFCLYLAKLVWPVGLSAIYAPTVHTSPDAVVLGCGVALAAIVWGGFRLFRCDRRLGFWFLFFWIGLLPFAQIVPIQWLITDRYMNVSIIGAAVLAAAGIVYLARRLATGRAWIAYAVAAIVVTGLACASFQRTGVWRDSLTLWSDAVAKEPESPHVWEHYAEALRFSGRTESARQAYERVRALQPTNTEMLAGLGDLYTEIGELDKGLELLTKLLEIRPDYVIGWTSLGTNYLKRGNHAEAERAYRQARALQPEAWQILTMSGNLERARGNLALAREYYEQVETRVQSGDNAYGLACIEAAERNREAALARLEKALQRGYGDYAALRGDRQLALLHDDPRFLSLLDRFFPAMATDPVRSEQDNAPAARGGKEMK